MLIPGRTVNHVNCLLSDLYQETSDMSDYLYQENSDSQTAMPDGPRGAGGFNIEYIYIYIYTYTPQSLRQLSSD